jgi:hypothetical protein
LHRERQKVPPGHNRDVRRGGRLDVDRTLIAQRWGEGVRPVLRRGNGEDRFAEKTPALAHELQGQEHGNKRSVEPDTSRYHPALLTRLADLDREPNTFTTTCISRTHRASSRSMREEPVTTVL